MPNPRSISNCTIERTRERDFDVVSFKRWGTGIEPEENWWCSQKLNDEKPVRLKANAGNHICIYTYVHMHICTCLRVHVRWYRRISAYMLFCIRVCNQLYRKLNIKVAHSNRFSNCKKKFILSRKKPVNHTPLYNKVVECFTVIWFYSCSHLITND